MYRSDRLRDMGLFYFSAFVNKFSCITNCGDVTQH